jgi:ribosomal protein L40E
MFLVPEFPMWLVVFVLVIVVITASTSSRRRRALERRRWEVKVCPNCATSHPGHANFCRTCGERL